MGWEVQVYIYDLSKGLARTLSSSILGKQIAGIWHTAIVVYSKEYYYGGSGIGTCPPRGTILKDPDEIVSLGTTEIPVDIFQDYLQELSVTSYRGNCYNLLNHNCNVFSNEVSEFLTGKSIPSYITNLPNEVLSTPFGALIRPFLESMNVDPGNNATYMNSSPPQQQEITGKGSTQHIVPNSIPTNSNDKRKSLKIDAITYENSYAPTNFRSIRGSISSKCDLEDLNILNEIAEFIDVKKKYWSLSFKHIQTVDKMIHKTDLSIEEKCTVLELLQETLLTEEVVSLIVFDRQQSFIKLIQQYDTISSHLTSSLAKLVCNLIANNVGSRGIWPSNDSKSSQISIHQSFLINFTSHCLLHENEDVVAVASSIAVNILLHKVPEETQNIIGFAVVEALSKDHPSITNERCIKSLYLCSDNSEVMGLARVMNLNIPKYTSSISSDCRPICDKLHKIILDI